MLRGWRYCPQKVFIWTETGWSSSCLIQRLRTNMTHFSSWKVDQIPDTEPNGIRVFNSLFHFEFINKRVGLGRDSCIIYVSFHCLFYMYTLSADLLNLYTLQNITHFSTWKGDQVLIKVITKVTRFEVKKCINMHLFLRGLFISSHHSMCFSDRQAPLHNKNLHPSVSNLGTKLVLNWNRNRSETQATRKFKARLHA